MELSRAATGHMRGDGDAASDRPPPASHPPPVYRAPCCTTRILGAGSWEVVGVVDVRPCTRTNLFPSCHSAVQALPPQRQHRVPAASHDGVQGVGGLDVEGGRVQDGAQDVGPLVTTLVPEEGTTPETGTRVRVGHSIRAREPLSLAQRCEPTRCNIRVDIVALHSRAWHS
jgi:hypothetical protein